MTGPLAVSESVDVTDAIVESCAVLDQTGKVLSFNKAFGDLILKGGPAADFDFAALGSSAVNGLARSAQGHFVEADAYIEADGILEGWRAAFVPQASGNPLMILAKENLDFAFFDTLTGLPNRLVTIERLGREWERWLRSKEDAYSFGIALADIDFFKRINDRYGHDIGDMALKQVSSWFTSSLRAGDWVARWGGEEFLLFFHDVGKKGSMIAAERCRETVSAGMFHSDTGLSFKMSVSMGVVATEDYKDPSLKPEDVQQMINDADVLLYDAKHEGRNRCIYRTGSDWLKLSASEINRILREGKLTAFGRKVTDAAGGTKGIFWQPRVRDMEHRAARHLFQSAIRSNLSGSVEAKWLDVCREASVEDPNHLSFAVVNPNTFQRLASQTDVIGAVKRHVLEGKNLVLAAKYDPMFGDHGRETRQALEDINAKACLWLPRHPTVPTGLLSSLRPTYVMFDEPFTDMDATFTDLLRILRDFGSTLILRSDMKDRDVDYPKVLYIDEYDPKKAS